MRWRTAVWIAGTGAIFLAYHLITEDTRAALNAGMAPVGMLDGRLPTIEKPMPWSADEARVTLTPLGEAGRAAYRDYLVRHDLGFALVIMPLFFTTILRALWPPRVALVGTFPALFDVLENLAILRMLDAFPDIVSLAGRWDPVFTLLKWGGVLTVIALCLSGVLKQTVTRPASAQ